MPTYCTYEDVKNTTRNTALKSAAKPVIESLIEQAEIIIDTYVCFVNTPSDQVRRFPRINDTGIISEVKYATIYQVEYMFEAAPDIDHGISDEKGDKNTKGNRYNVISHRAKHLLTNIRQVVAKPFTIRNNEYDVTI